MSELDLTTFRKLQKEIAGLQFSIDNCRPELMADTYKDYNTGYPIVKTVRGYVYDERWLSARYEELGQKLKEAQAQADRIREYIENLEDEELRTIARLYYLDGYSMEDIGEVMHCDKSTVCRKLQHMQQK